MKQTHPNIKDFHKSVRGLFLAAILALGGCAEQTANVEFTIDYSDEFNAIVQNGKVTTVRLFYTFDGLKPTNIIQPPESVPRVVQIGSDDEDTAFNWATATQQGFSIADGKVELSGVPLGKRATEIGIEFLQRQDDGQFYVVGFFCITGPVDRGYSKAQLKADTSQVRLVQAGRTCGSCSTIENPDNVTTPCI